MKDRAYKKAGGVRPDKFEKIVLAATVVGCILVIISYRSSFTGSRWHVNAHSGCDGSWSLGDTTLAYTKEESSRKTLK